MYYFIIPYGVYEEINIDRFKNKNDKTYFPNKFMLDYLTLMLILEDYSFTNVKKHKAESIQTEQQKILNEYNCSKHISSINNTVEFKIIFK